MKNFKGLAIFLLLATVCLGYLSCQKEISGEGGIIPTETVDDLTKTKASVEGYVNKETGLPLAGATVTSGGVTVITDAKGYFRFNDISLSKSNGHVSVTMAGYFNGSRSFLTASGKVNFIQIQLIPKSNPKMVDATAGGIVTLTNGLKISFPPGAFVVASSNTPYNGQVTVNATWLNPVGNNLDIEMPGDLRGISATGGERGLQTYGMMAAELTGSGGEKLAIASGKMATVTFPLPAAFAGSAPSSIPLWHFDEATGRWKEEGSATIMGDTYVAEVSHFSFWNCDAPFPLVSFSATVLSSGGAPLVHAKVRIKTLSNASATGYTDSTGFVTGKIPANVPLVLHVLDQCNNSIYSQNIGPYNANINLGTVTVNTASVALRTISGSITNCSGAPVTSGYADISIDYRHYRAQVNSAGQFSVTFTTCTTNTAMSVIGVDNGTNQQSAPTPYILSAASTTLPPLQACGTSSLQTINYTVDAMSYTITSPPDSIKTSWIPNNLPSFSGELINGFSLTAPDKRIGFFVAYAPGIGVHELKSVKVGGLDSANVIDPFPRVNISQYGAVGDFIVGDFTVQMKDAPTNIVHTVTCNFRVIRN